MPENNLFKFGSVKPSNNDNETKISMIEDAWNTILDAFYVDWRSDENFRDTPTRIAKSMVLERCSGIDYHNLDYSGLETKSFPTQFNGMIVSQVIRIHSLCPHHFEDVRYKVVVGYIPTQHDIPKRCKVPGLSKISETVKMIGRAPILQEDFTNILASLMVDKLSVEGLGVATEAIHNCMCARGVEQGEHADGVTMIALRGSFLKNLDVNKEFTTHVNRKFTMI